MYETIIEKFNDAQPIDLVIARMHAGLTPGDVAKLCSIHPRTLARQETGQARLSRPLYGLLLMLGGLLPGDSWRG